jgi:hypothetical protein
VTLTQIQEKQSLYELGLLPLCLNIIRHILSAILPALAPKDFSAVKRMYWELEGPLSRLINSMNWQRTGRCFGIWSVALSTLVPANSENKRTALWIESDLGDCPNATAVGGTRKRSVLRM